MDFGAFFSAYFSDWVGYMSGIGSVGLTVFGYMLPTASQKRTFWALAFVVFLIAPVHIWTIEHRARVTAEDVSKPRLSADIGMIVAGTAHNEATFVLDVSFKNHGAPSIANLREMVAHLQSGKTVVGKLVPAPLHDINIPGKNGMSGITLTHDEYLLRRAQNNPIERGGGMTGWLFFVLPGVSENEVLGNSTRINLSFTDVNDTIVSTQATFDGKNSTGNVYMPGIPIRQP